MKEYVITLINTDDNTTKLLKVKRLTFPEAVQQAYKNKNILGFNWMIKSIMEIEPTKD